MRLSMLLVLLFGMVSVTFAKNMPPNNDITNRKIDLELCCDCDCETDKKKGPFCDPKDPFKSGICNRICRSYCKDYSGTKNPARFAEGIVPVVPVCCPCMSMSVGRDTNFSPLRKEVGFGVCNKICKFLCEDEISGTAYSGRDLGELNRSGSSQDSSDEGDSLETGGKIPPPGRGL